MSKKIFSFFQLFSLCVCCRRHSGLQLGGDKVQLYTTDDVLEEVRDKKARQMLETLPFELKTREPSSEHIREGEFVSIIFFFLCKYMYEIYV